MRITTKIGLMVAAPILALGGLAGYGWRAITHVADGGREVLADHCLPLLNRDIPLLVNDLGPCLDQILLAQRDATQAVVAEKAALAAAEEAEFTQVGAQSQALIDAAHAAIETAAGHLPDAEATPLFADLQEKFAAWTEKTRAVIEKARDPEQTKFARKMSNGGSAQKNFEALCIAFAAVEDLINRRVASVVSGVDASRGEIEEHSQALTADAATAVHWFALVAAAAGVLSITIATYLSRGVTRALKHAIAALNERVAQLNDASAQVAATAEQLAEGASRQAASLEQTSSALEELAAMSHTNAGHAGQANTLSGQTSSAAKTSDATMSRLNTTMTAINESSGRISRIIKVIEEIAFQTNLLALNAAVEAARAGEHGKGFAVVAEEVRNLAQRAGQAAKETTGLIDETVSRVRQGAEVATEVTDSLTGIFGNVTQVSTLISQIAAASEQQAQGVGQLNSAVADMDRVTQSNAAGAEESAAAARTLAGEATGVRDIVAELAALVIRRQEAKAVAASDCA